MSYLAFDKKNITDLSPENVSRMYSEGYVFTRTGPGHMEQTRSLRIDLSKFELSSENRRILKKMEGFQIIPETLPLDSYDWQLGKLAKDFYEVKFGPKTFTANKVKQLLTSKHNFNLLLAYVKDEQALGFCIAHAGESFLHYSYPFYDLESAPKDMGMGMMLMAIMLAKEEGDQYIYLGSASRPTDTYKLQFSGLQWFTPSGVEGFTGDNWSTDLDVLKAELA